MFEDVFEGEMPWMLKEQQAELELEIEEINKGGNK